MANLDSPRGQESARPSAEPAAPPAGQPASQPVPPGYQQPGTANYPPGNQNYPPGNRPPMPMGTTYSGVPPTVDTPAEPARTDWVQRDRRDPDGTQVIDPDARARGTGRHSVPHEQFIDTDQRMALGGEEYYEGEPYPETYRARVSWLAVLGLVLGVVGALAALTGVLAPVGLLAGAVGLLFGLAGLVATRRPHVASRPLAVTGLLISIGALVLAWLAMTGDYGWLNRDDQAGWLRDWLDARLPWIENW